MIIGACGYGGTGSSAVSDFLKEFSTVQVLDRAEFQYAFKVDGLQDLEYHLVRQYSRQMSGDIAIKRFKDASRYAYTPFVKKPIKFAKKYIEITDDYINSLIQTSWRGLDNYDFETGFLPKSVTVLAYKKFIIPYYEKITGRLFNHWPIRDMHLSIKPKDFYKKTRKYTTSILNEMGADFDKKIVLDQPFEGNNPAQSFRFFEDPIAIVVDRDPRDLYLASSYQWPDGTFMPRRDPEAFVEYFERQREEQSKLNEMDRVLFVRLEEMIFNYSSTIEKIMSFLKLSEEEHKFPMKFFNPNYSIQGTQLYKKIKGHEKEIEYISNRLKEYIFPFENYDIAKDNNKLVWIP